VLPGLRLQVTSSFFSMVPHINPPTRVTMATAERLLPRIIGTHGNKQLRNGLRCVVVHKGRHCCNNTCRLALLS
jgi:hypothetical protein